jgi:hypothetical protein
MTRPHSSNNIGKDDRAVAGVVGFVLILAAAVTYYSYAAQNEVPRIGAENERAWDGDVGSALAALAASAGERAGTDAAVSQVVPSAPEAPTQTVPFLAPLRSARATGSISYDAQCGGVRMSHEVGGVTIDDLLYQAGSPAAAGRGCISFQGGAIYAEPFQYRLELGGVLRIQGADAVVLAGPPLDVSPGRIAITMINLSGSSQTLGLGANAPITLTPRSGALEVGMAPNADALTWTFTTEHPPAWREWYMARFAAVGVAADVEESPGAVTVSVTEPTSLSISYGRYDVSLG